MNFSNVKIISFIEHIITFDNVKDILLSCESSVEKGFIFERLFDIVIKFGFCDLFQNNEYYHLTENANNGKLKILKHFDKYLNDLVISGKSSGCSDITLKNKKDDTYIFMSSKHIYSNTHSIMDYDIQNIISMATHNSNIYSKFKIFLLVINRKKVLKLFKNANEASLYITKFISNDNILDLSDLNNYFLKFKHDIIKNKNSNWTDIYLSPKETLILRFHQELITQKTFNLIQQNNKIFLWGCKCRSGKTYMVGGIIKKLSIKKLNVLIITPAPTETISQFTEDLFYKFRDFNHFKIHSIEGIKFFGICEIERK